MNFLIAPTTFVDMGRYYLDEIYAAVVEVRETLGDVQDLADEGSGTEEPGMLEKRAVQVVERVSRWRSEQKRLLSVEVEGKSGTSVSETKDRDSEKSKAQLPQQTKKGENELKKEQKGGKGKERELVYLSEKQAQEVSQSFVKEVWKGLKNRNVEQEEREILDMRKILLETIKQRSSNKQKAKGKD